MPNLPDSPFRRSAEIAVAIVAAAGVLLELVSSTLRLGSFTGALGFLLGYFTIWTNLGVAVVFTGRALGSNRLSHPALLAGITLAYALVGIVFHFLLRDTVQFVGLSAIANVLLHQLGPAIAPLYWLALAPKGTLTRWDPPRWALYPIAYFAFALVRGQFTRVYPYPFIDVGALGWTRTVINALVIATGFLAVGAGVVWADHRFADRRSR